MIWLSTEFSTIAVENTFSTVLPENKIFLQTESTLILIFTPLISFSITPWICRFEISPCICIYAIEVSNVFICDVFLVVEAWICEFKFICSIVIGNKLSYFRPVIVLEIVEFSEIAWSIFFSISDVPIFSVADKLSCSAFRTLEKKSRTRLKWRNWITDIESTSLNTRPPQPYN